MSSTVCHPGVGEEFVLPAELDWIVGMYEHLLPNA